MKSIIQLKSTTPALLIALALACFGLLPKLHAVVPAPDGGYPGGNTAEGQAALLSLTTGGYNTAVGFFSLRSNTTNGFNTAIGAGTLLANTADENTAVGAGALLSNTTGTNNTANGAFALFHNTTGSYNTANGAFALFSNTTGGNNTATGKDALISNTTGANNTANGYQALFSSTGSNNTAIGYIALQSNSTGFENTAVGYQALVNNTGAGNTAVGYLAGQNLTTGDDNIDIGSDGVAGDAGIIRIGRSFIGATYIAGTRGVTTGRPDAIPVLIDSAGQLGTASSSRRFKKEIKPMDKASESILSLKPVTFHYKTGVGGMQQFGLIAEEVAEVNPDLVVRDEKGEIYTVRYDAVNAMLLNEFLKEHHQMQDLKAIVAEQQKQIETLTAGLQKVSAQLEASKPAPQTVLNSQ